MDSEKLRADIQPEIDYYEKVKQTALADAEARSLDFDTQLIKFTARQNYAVDILDWRDTGLSPCKYLLYGGAVGGGKSWFIRWYTVRRLMLIAQGLPDCKPIRGARAMIACEDYPTLKDRQLAAISQEFPQWLGRSHTDHKDFGRCFVLRDEWGGGIIQFRNLDDPSKYASAEFALICVDELTKNTLDTFTFLRYRLRWPGLPDHELQFIGGSNPGGPGHAWVKQLWIDRDFSEEWKGYEDTFYFVPAKVEDNPHLDPSYFKQLDTLPPQIREAFRDGDWNIFSGQAFPELTEKDHVIPPHPVPEDAPLYMTFDWGASAPFAIMWYYINAEKQIIMFEEWYGWNGSANKGLRLADSDIANGIIEREKKMGIWERQITRYAGHDCFARPWNKNTGQPEKSTAEIFIGHGLNLVKSQPDRKKKIRSFREAIKVPTDGGLPKLLIFNKCKQFMRTVPALVTKEPDHEDVDDKGEDHSYDSVCMICQARFGDIVDQVRGPKSMAQRDWEIVTGGGQDSTAFVSDEWDDSELDWEEEY